MTSSISSAGLIAGGSPWLRFITNLILELAEGVEKARRGSSWPPATPLWWTCAAVCFPVGSAFALGVRYRFRGCESALWRWCRVTWFRISHLRGRPDAYMKVVLTIIALCLMALVVRQRHPVASAQFGFGCDGSPRSAVLHTA